jgi:HemY protein
VHAPRDPAWTADGVTAAEWQPVSPVTGKLDAFEWKVPVSAVALPAGGPGAALLTTGEPPPVPASKPATDQAAQ